MTSQKPKKFISVLIVLTMILALLPASLGLAASYATVEDFVENLYVAGLGRQPDLGGYNYWVEQLKNGRPAAEAVGFVLLDAPEFKEKYKDISNEEFVKKAYEIVFARPADEDGLEYWVDAMDRGASQRYVIVAMLYAPTGEFQEFCDTVGIKLGTIDVPIAEYPSDEPTELAVEEVSAINLKQIMIKVNSSKLLDEDAATNLDNYTLEDSNEIEIKLNDAEVVGDAVVLTISDEFDSSNNYDPEGYPIENQDKAVLTIDDEVIGKEQDFDITFFDNQIPRAFDAKVVGSDTIKVYFDEPIKPTGYDSSDKVFLIDKDCFEVDGGDYYIRRVELVNNNTEANVITYSDLDEGTVTVTVDDAKDYAGFKVPSTNLTSVVVEDNESPYIIGYKDADENGITLLFNEDVKLTEDAAKGLFFHTNTKNTVDDDGFTVDGNKLTLSFKENNLPDGIAYVYVDEGALVDLWGNENDDLWIEVYVEYDKVAPEVEKVEQSWNQTIVKVYFSDNDIDEKSAKEKDNYTLLDSDGDEVDNDIISIKFNTTDDNKDYVEITYEDPIEAGDYLLVIEEVEDISGNEMDKTTKSLTIKDKTAPVITEFKPTLYKDGNDQILIIRFGERMKTDNSKYSVVDLEKYKIGNTVLAYISSSVEIKAIEDDKAVRIIIPTDKLYVAPGSKIEIGRVADASGNYSRELYGSVPIEDGSKKAIGFKSVEATAVDTIVVTFEDLFDDFDAEDIYFETKDGTDLTYKKSKTSVNSDGQTVCTYTLIEDYELNYDGTYQGKTVTAKVVGDPISKSKYDVPLDKDAEKEIADKIAPALDKIKVSGSDKDYVAVDVKDKIVALYFAEKIDPKSVSVMTFEVEDMNVNDVRVDVWEGNGVEKSVVYLMGTLKYGVDKLETGLDVTQKVAIKDASNNGNKVSDIDTEIAIEEDIDKSIFEEADTEAPTFEYDGNTLIVVNVGDEFELPEVTATDNKDGNDVEVSYEITNADGNKVDKITTNVDGEYVITYSAKDNAGNEAELKITVVVKGTTEKAEPTGQYNTFVADEIEGVELSISSGTATFDLSLAKQQTLNEEASKQKPSEENKDYVWADLVLTAPDNATGADAYQDGEETYIGNDVSDNEYVIYVPVGGRVEEDGKVVYKEFSENKVYNFAIIWKDSDNNVIKRESLTVEVIMPDREAPVITLKGEQEMEVEVGTTFEDPGYEVSDNVDEKPEVTVEGEVNTNIIGVYTITYTAVDAAGNETKVERTVKVVTNDIATEGLALWLDADNSGSVVVDKENGLVKKWISKVGQYEALADVSDLKDSRPEYVEINGKNMIRFNGAQYFVIEEMDGEVANISIFVVSQRTKEQSTGQTWQRILSCIDPTGSENDDTKAPNFCIVGENPDIGNGNAESYELYTLDATKNDVKLTNLGIGVNMQWKNHQFFMGDIAEIIIYNRLLAEDEVNEVKQYLSNKWEISN